LDTLSEVITNFLLKENEELKEKISKMNNVEEKLLEFKFKKLGGDFVLELDKNRSLTVTKNTEYLLSIKDKESRIELLMTETFDDIEMFLKAFKVVVYRPVFITYDSRE
jgi:hypothetical protein